MPLQVMLVVALWYALPHNSSQHGLGSVPSLIGLLVAYATGLRVCFDINIPDSLLPLVKNPRSATAVHRSDTGTCIVYSDSVASAYHSLSCQFSI